MKTRTVASAGVALVASVVLAVILVGCSDDQKEQIAAQNEAASQRTGTIPIFELRAGDCFDDTLGLIGASTGDVGETGEVTLLSCSDVSADIEVTRLLTVEREGAFPGEEYMDEVAGNQCPGFANQADEYVTYFLPTRESWELDDRTITCLRSLR